jgi:hypothetical protein
MTIPFLAILSCLLLASNNPSTLHGILGVETKAVHTWKPIADAFEGPFKVVDLWNRGPNKLFWFHKTLEQYEIADTYSNDHAYPMQSLGQQMAYTNHTNYFNTQTAAYSTSQLSSQPPSTSQSSQPESKERRLGQIAQLKKIMTPRQRDLSTIFALALAPLFVSFILAFLTSYSTPRVGLACRSLTHVLYFVIQFLQMVVWMVHNRKVAEEDENAESSCTMVLRDLFCTILKWCLGLAAIFVSIGGTFMQLVGIYRNCLCKVTTPSPPFFLKPMLTVHESCQCSTGYKRVIRTHMLFWEQTTLRVSIMPKSIGCELQPRQLFFLDQPALLPGGFSDI